MTDRLISSAKTIVNACWPNHLKTVLELIAAVGIVNLLLGLSEPFLKQKYSAKSPDKYCNKWKLPTIVLMFPKNHLSKMTPTSTEHKKRNCEK